MAVAVVAVAAVALVSWAVVRDTSEQQAPAVASTASTDTVSSNQLVQNSIDSALAANASSVTVPGATMSSSQALVQAAIDAALAANNGG